MDTIDTSVLGGKVKVKQPTTGGLRVTMDTIFVAAACPARPGDHIADFGAGTGAAGLCVAVRESMVKITFVEIQPDYADLCLENAALNGVGAESVCCDVRALKKKKFDHIVCNPPYLAEGTHYVSPDPKRQKALGVQTGEAQLADWIAAAARNLKDKGSLSLIHRADALDDVLMALRAHKFGAIEIWPLHPYADKDASRIVVRGYLRRKTLLKLHPAIVLHDKGVKEKYSETAERILLENKMLT